MKTLSSIQREVGEWSLANFGNQRSKVNPEMLLGSLAPLMGMAEEIGEFAGAKSVEDMRDALGDVLIYLCDYASREGLELPDDTPPMPTGVNVRNLGLSLVVEALGVLFHHTLKRHQGIRGYDNLGFYEASRNNAVIGLLNAIDALCKEIGMDRDDVLNFTWEAVVKKRNWVANPTEGAAASAAEAIGTHSV